MKKVLHIIDNFKTGGAQAIIRQIIRFSTNAEHHICCLRKTSLGIDNYFSPGYNLRTISSIITYVKKNAIDIIHTHLEASSIIGSYIANAQGIALINHDHSNTEQRFQKGCYVRRLFWKKCGNPRGISIMVSKAVFQFNERFFGKRNPTLKIVYNGIDTDYFRPLKSERPRELGKAKFVIGFAGRLTKQKGIGVLLEAYSRLANKYSDITLLIAGSGVLEKQVRNVIRTQRLPNVHIYNNIKKMPEFYNSLDVYVQPSIWEPFGLTVAEAMACSIPVVASRIGGVTEIIDDKKDGILTKPEPAILAQAIERLLNDNNLAASIKSCCRDKITQKFTVQKMVEQIENVYEESSN